MKDIIKIAKAAKWDTLLKDSPEYKVYALAVAASEVKPEPPVNEHLEERANEVLEVIQPKKKPVKKTKKGKK